MKEIKVGDILRVHNVGLLPDTYPCIGTAIVRVVDIRSGDYEYRCNLLFGEWAQPFNRRSSGDFHAREIAEIIHEQENHRELPAD